MCGRITSIRSAAEMSRITRVRQVRQNNQQGRSSSTRSSNNRSNRSSNNNNRDGNVRSNQINIVQDEQLHQNQQQNQQDNQSLNINNTNIINNLHENNGCDDDDDDISIINNFNDNNNIENYNINNDNIFQPGFNLAPSSTIHFIRRNDNPHQLPTLDLDDNNNQNDVDENPTNFQYVMDNAIWGLNSTTNHNKYFPLHNIRSDNNQLITNDFLIPAVMVIDSFVEWKDPLLSTQIEPNHTLQHPEAYFQQYDLNTNEIYHNYINNSSIGIHSTFQQANQYVNNNNTNPTDIKHVRNQSPHQPIGFNTQDKEQIYQLIKNQPIKALDSELVTGKRIKQPYVIYSGVQLCSQCNLRCEYTFVPKAKSWPYCQCQQELNHNNGDDGDMVNNNNNNNNNINNPNSTYETILKHDALYIAGVYNVTIDPTTKESTITCGMITLESNIQMGWMHDRMPFILSPFQIEEWLSYPTIISHNNQQQQDNNNIKQFTPLQQHKINFLNKYIQPFYSLSCSLPTSSLPTQPYQSLQVYYSISPKYSFINWYPINPLISKITTGGQLFNTSSVLNHLELYKKEASAKNLGRFFGIATSTTSLQPTSTNQQITTTIEIDHDNNNHELSQEQSQQSQSNQLFAQLENDMNNDDIIEVTSTHKSKSSQSQPKRITTIFPSSLKSPTTNNINTTPIKRKIPNNSPIKTLFKQTTSTKIINLDDDIKSNNNDDDIEFTSYTSTTPTKKSKSNNSTNNNNNNNHKSPFKVVQLDSQDYNTNDDDNDFILTVDDNDITTQQQHSTPTKINSVLKKTATPQTKSLLDWFPTKPSQTPSATNSFSKPSQQKSQPNSNSIDLTSL